MLTDQNRDTLIAVMPDEREELSMPQRKNEWRPARPQRLDRFSTYHSVAPRCGECAESNATGEHSGARRE
jgi:hypothetical protein